MAINHVGTQGIKDSHSATTTSTRGTEGGRFVSTRALKDIEAGFGDRAPVYRPSSGHAGRVAATDRSVSSTTLTA